MTRPTLEQELLRFRDALNNCPDVADRVAKGQQFNAYDVATDDDEEDAVEKFVCIGPITSRPVSMAQLPADVADLLVAGLRVAAAVSALTKDESQ